MDVPGVPPTRNLPSSPIQLIAASSAQGPEPCSDSLLSLRESLVLESLSPDGSYPFSPEKTAWHIAQ